MGAIKLKQDLQEAIALNIKKYYGDYGAFLVDKNNKEYIGSLYFMKKIDITINDNKMLYEIELDEETTGELSKEEIEKIKMCDIKNKMGKAIMQQIAQNNTIFTIEENLEEKKKSNKNATSYDYNKIRITKQILKSHFKIDFNVNESENFLAIEANLDELHLNKKMINDLLVIAQYMDIVAIVPLFKEEETVGVRLFFAIDLTITEED